MSLEAALTYLVALAVPVWLLVEQLVLRRRSHGEKAAAKEAARPEPREPGKAAVPEAATLAARKDSVSGGMRRRAA
jgi:hypothetical protein